MPGEEAEQRALPSTPPRLTPVPAAPVPAAPVAEQEARDRRPERVAQLEALRAEASDLLQRGLAHLPPSELLALQLHARGYSLRQIGLLLAARDRSSPDAGRLRRALEERDLLASGRDALDKAARTLGCTTHGEAVHASRRAGLVL
jgi:hypothetical protein